MARSKASKQERAQRSDEALVAPPINENHGSRKTAVIEPFLPGTDEAAPKKKNGRSKDRPFPKY